MSVSGLGCSSRLDSSLCLFSVAGNATLVSLDDLDSVLDMSRVSPDYYEVAVQAIGCVPLCSRVPYIGLFRRGSSASTLSSGLCTRIHIPSS